MKIQNTWHSLSKLPRKLKISDYHWRIICWITSATLFIFHVWVWQRLHLFSLLTEGSTPQWDLDAYYQLAQDMRLGLNPYQVSHMQTLGPPIVILPYLFFTLLTLPQARIVMLGLTLVSVYLGSWWLVRLIQERFKHLQTLPAWLGLSLVVLTAFPTRFNFITGQPNVVIMMLLAGIFLARTGFLRGLLLSICVVGKTHLLWAWLSARRWSRQQIFWAVGLLVVIFLLSLTVIHSSWYHLFLTQRLAATTFTPAQAIGVDYYNQTLKATLYRFGISDSYRLLYPLLLVGVSWWIFHRGSLVSGLLWSVWLGPVFWQHYQVLIWPLLVVVFLREKKWQWIKAVLALFIIGSSWIEFSSLHNQELTFLTAMLGSHYFFAWTALTWWAAWQDQLPLSSRKNKTKYPTNKISQPDN